MGVYYSATPPTVQREGVSAEVSAQQYLTMGEDACAQLIRNRYNIPVYVTPYVRKSEWSGYTFKFSWYMIMTDGD